MHLPGAGVGGHCLPKDPWLLVYGGKDTDPKLMPAARAVNEQMPEHMKDLVFDALKEAGIKPTKKTRITVLGYSFLENSGDTRNSPSKHVIDSLKKKVIVTVHDPHAIASKGLKIERNLEKSLKESDCAVLMTKHKEYIEFGLEKMSRLMRNRIIVDGRNIYDKTKARRLGFIYRGIGKG